MRHHGRVAHSNAQVLKDYAAAYAAAHPDKPAPLVGEAAQGNLYVKEGWGRPRFMRHAAMRAEIGQLLIQAATRRGTP